MHVLATQSGTGSSLWIGPFVKQVQKKTCTLGAHGAKDTPIDDLFDNSSIEWYTKRIGSPVLYGLLLKLITGRPLWRTIALAAIQHLQQFVQLGGSWRAWGKSLATTGRTTGRFSCVTGRSHYERYLLMITRGHRLIFMWTPFKIDVPHWNSLRV